MEVDAKLKILRHNLKSLFSLFYDVSCTFGFKACKKCFKVCTYKIHNDFQEKKNFLLISEPKLAKIMRKKVKDQFAQKKS